MTPLTLDQWATRWNIPPQALYELVVTACPDPPAPTGTSEAAVQQQVRLVASREGVRLWRNNVGAMDDGNGRIVRFGLANESAQLNAVMKSSDLIGITPITVAGQTLGVFTSIEVKRGNWVYKGTPREKAQLNWINMIRSLGGIAKFSTGEL